ncbi:MAG: VOC family protein [Acidimicrobiales bacterium]
MAVSPSPADYPRLCPSIAVSDCAAAIDFYVTVLGAEERGGRMMMPDGRVGHAELTIGDSVIILADEFPESGYVGPTAVGGTPVTLSLFVEDADATFTAALANGATELRAVEDQFYGHRSGQFIDPWGHRWSVQQVIEEVSDEEMSRRMAAMGG